MKRKTDDAVERLSGSIHHSAIQLRQTLGRLFLRLLDKHFPRSHILRKLFNQNTIKVSYSCMENIAHIIKKTQSANFLLQRKAKTIVQLQK